jgi:hypothetical protein
MRFFSVVVLLLACVTCVAQSDCKQSLARCSDRVQEWQDTWDSYKPFCEQLKTENATLKRDANSAPEQIFVAFAAVGFGAFLAYLVSRGVWRVWPLSFEHKQLAVLVLAAGWVSIAALIAASDSRFSYHPMSSALKVGVWSIPALVFGAVAFWWFGKKHPSRLF